MKIVSFDVGIKHLAFCVLTHQDSNTYPNQEQQQNLDYQIQDWQVINLMESIESIPTIEVLLCIEHLKPKSKTQSAKKCGKKAIYQTPDGSQSFCKKHSENHPQYLLPTLFPMTKTQLSKMSQEELQILASKMTDLKKPPSPPLFQKEQSLLQHSSQTQIQKLPIQKSPKTKKEWLQQIEQIRTTLFLKPVAKPAKMNAKHAGMIGICQSLIQKFEIFKDSFQDITHVVIENQLGSNATRMMILQGMITMYFSLHTQRPVIAHVSSSHKLKYAYSLLNSSKPDFKKQEKQTYQEHKQNAVLYAEQILVSHLPESYHTHHFKNLKNNKADEKKRDDLADCFLQGLWYLSTIAAPEGRGCPAPEGPG